MSRYVNADYVKAVMLNDRLLQGNAEYELYKQKVDAQVKAMPTIDIVRCQDCKYWNMVSNGCMRNPSVEGWQADDFCSYGERKEQ